MAEVARSDQYGALPNSGQVARARRERQIQAGDIEPANSNVAPNPTIRNTNVVRFGEVRDTKKTNSGKTITNAYPDTAAAFNESYARAGIQPSNISVTPTKSTASTTQTSVRAAAVTYQTPEYEEDIEAGFVSNQATQKKTALRVVKRERARMRATEINAWVLSIASTVSFVVIIFSIFSVVFFGLAFFFEYLKAWAGITDADGDGKISLAGRVLSLFEWAITKFIAALGFDPTLLDPMNLFMISYMVTMGFGLLILFIMYLIYTISFIKCLSGEHATFKKGAFLISLIGHCLPFVGFLPWFLVWGIAVWLYPK